MNAGVLGFIVRLRAAVGEPPPAMHLQAPLTVVFSTLSFPLVSSPPHIEISSTLLGPTEILFSGSHNFH